MTLQPELAPAEAGAHQRRDALLLGQVSLAHLVSHVHIMVVPSLLPLLPAHFGRSFIEIGAAMTVFNFVSLIVQTPMGFATERFGPRRVLIAGLIVGGLSFLSLAAMPSYPALIVAMAAAGLANGVYHPADYALLSRGIDGKRMGRAFSIHTFAGYIGTAISPPLLLATAALAGVAYAFVLAGVMAIASAAVLIASGPVGPDSAGAAARRPTSAGEPATPRARLLTGAVLSMMLMFVLLNLSTSGLQSFSVSAFVMGYGVDLATASAALTAFLFASAFGVLAGGTLADRTSRHGLVAVGAFLATALICLALALTTPPAWGLFALMALAGFLSGIITPSRDMMVRAASPKGAEGIVFGIVSTGFNIGGLIGPLLFAMLLDQRMPRTIFIVAAGFMVLTVVLALVQERRRAS